MTKLQKIVALAKKIRTAHPKKYAKWTDYIKAASKQIAGLEGVKRVGSKTTVTYTRKLAKKILKTQPKKVEQKTLFGVKGSTHKDTKSHNVNIRVISGVGSTSYKALDEIKQGKQKILQLEKELKNFQEELKNNYTRGTYYKPNKIKILSEIKDIKETISFIKKHIQNLKKIVK